jgi:integrase
MASASKGKNGTWRILFVDAGGIRRAIYLGRSPLRIVNELKRKVAALNTAKMAGICPDEQTAFWVGRLEPLVYDKLSAVGLLPEKAKPVRAILGAFLDAYIVARADVKCGTTSVYGQAKRHLLEYFGTDKPLSTVTQWRIWLGSTKGLAENTVNRRCSLAKQFFRAAVRQRIIPESPFGDMKNCSVRGNQAREYFVSRAESQKVIDACPDAQWRLLFALSRFGGMRCPSEHLALRWSDVDFARRRLTIHSTKTEHHADGGIRQIPIFDELLPYLHDAYDVAEPGANHVITRYRTSNCNLRTQLHRIIEKAGLKPWPKLFQNLRSTRETELAEVFPIHVVCQWIGNSQAVAKKFYLQVTDEHFARAISQTSTEVEFTENASSCASSI